MKRKHIPMETKYAAALLTMRREDENGNLVPIIPYEEAKSLTPKQIISRFELQHYPVPHAFGGSDHPSNLIPMIKADHREVTAKVDVPRIAKAKRLSRSTIALAAVLAAKVTGDVLPASAKRNKYQWPKGRKIPTKSSKRNVITRQPTT